MSARVSHPPRGPHGCSPSELPENLVLFSWDSDDIKYSSPRLPLTLMALLSRLRAIRRGEHSAAREQSSPQLPHSLPVLSRLGAGNSPTPDLDGVSSPSRRFTQLAQDLRISLPSTCHWLEPADVDLIGERPMAAGEFSNIWEGTHDGRKVVLKSHCYATLSDVTQVIEVCWNHCLLVYC